jgi:hypothetical protein
MLPSSDRGELFLSPTALWLLLQSSPVPPQKGADVRQLAWLHLFGRLTN